MTIAVAVLQFSNCLVCKYNIMVLEKGSVHLQKSVLCNISLYSDTKNNIIIDTSKMCIVTSLRPVYVNPSSLYAQPL